jgi:hypothetical protein
MISGVPARYVPAHASTTCAAVTPGAAAPGRPMQQQQRQQCCCQRATEAAVQQSSWVPNMSGYPEGSAPARHFDQGQQQQVLQVRSDSAGKSGRAALHSLTQHYRAVLTVAYLLLHGVGRHGLQQRDPPCMLPVTLQTLQSQQHATWLHCAQIRLHGRRIQQIQQSDS